MSKIINSYYRERDGTLIRDKPHTGIMLDDTIWSYNSICNIHDRIFEIEKDCDRAKQHPDEKRTILDKYGYESIDVSDFYKCMKKYHRNVRNRANKIIEIVIEMCDIDCMDSDDEEYNSNDIEYSDESSEFNESDDIETKTED